MRCDIRAEQLCIPHLTRSEQFSMLYLPKKLHVAGPVRTRTKYSTVIEEVGNMKEKQQASVRCKEVSSCLTPAKYFLVLNFFYLGEQKS